MPRTSFSLARSIANLTLLSMSHYGYWIYYYYYYFACCFDFFFVLCSIHNIIIHFFLSFVSSSSHFEHDDHTHIHTQFIRLYLSRKTVNCCSSYSSMCLRAFRCSTCVNSTCIFQQPKRLVGPRLDSITKANTFNVYEP